MGFVIGPVLRRVLLDTRRAMIAGIIPRTPMNLKLYFEIQKSSPDHEKRKRWMRAYVRVVAVQGAMQVLIVLVMARFATGL